MTRDEILLMPASREMDVLVAKEIFGDIKKNWDWEFTLPEYSTNISAAWKVVEKMHSQGWASSVEYDIHTYDCDFSNVQGIHGRVTANGMSSAPLAICRAALLTTLEEQ